LYNSNRLMQFPLALFGIAMSTAALPALSASAAQGNLGELKKTLQASLRFVMFAILPAMAGLLALGVPIIQILFEHGRFTHEHTLLTHQALMGLCVGLPAFAATKVMVSAFYSVKDIRTPVRVATGCFFINLVGNFSLMKWGVLGLSLATAVASTVNALILFEIFRRTMGGVGGRRLLKTFLQSAGCATAMAFVTGILGHFLPVSLSLRVLLGVLSGVTVYLVLARCLGMEEFDLLWNAVKNARRRFLPGPEKAAYDDSSEQ
jgi:putative peptidoglycan lipid II flippase